MTTGTAVDRRLNALAERVSFCHPLVATKHWLPSCDVSHVVEKSDFATALYTLWFSTTDRRWSTRCSGVVRLQKGRKQVSNRREMRPLPFSTRCGIGATARRTTPSTLWPAERRSDVPGWRCYSTDSLDRASAAWDYHLDDKSFPVGAYLVGRRGRPPIDT